MKNKSLYLVGITTLILGFALAWLIKPSDHQTIKPSDHQTIKPSNHQYTCSMHPQIRQNEPGDCPICGMDLIPLEANASNDPHVLEMTKEAVKLANIQTTLVGIETGQVGKTIRLSGKVQADERRAFRQVAHVPGRIEKLYVTFTGESVQEGQKLAEIYSPQLITAQRELLEASKLKGVNTSLLEAARNKLRFWKIGEEAIKAIEEKKTIQETFTLYAGESGIVTQRRVAVGDHLNEGEPLFDLMNLNKVWVLFDAYEQDLAHISIGNRIEFTTPSIPNRTFTTLITFIDPVINPTTRVASLRTEMNNPGGLLKPEMFVRGMLKKRASPSAQLSVPKTAVLWTGTRSVVYVKIPDTTIPSFQFREVELGEKLGDAYQIISGLEAGEEVVTYGSFTIDAAAQLNNQASMMNKKVLLKGVDHSQHLPDYTESTPIAFKQQLVQVVEAYLSLKDALVATDSEQAKKAATPLLKAISAVDMALLTGDAHEYWMQQLNALQAHSEKIEELDDVEEQRIQFDFLSQALITAVKVFGIPEETFFVQHCPMAFDDAGADWLSRVEEISNPYFGDKMLRCGVTKEKITKDYKNPSTEQASNAPGGGHNH